MAYVCHRIGAEISYHDTAVDRLQVNCSLQPRWRQPHCWLTFRDNASRRGKPIDSVKFFPTLFAWN